jgi:tetratricopeptide (TPR) repeat protein/predicted alpha/beta hydrolase family esterase
MKKKEAEQYLIDDDLFRIPNAVDTEADTAVLFVHGFTGDGIGTWGEYPERLRNDPELAGIDLFFWQYPTKLNPFELVSRSFWSADPDIEMIGQSLRTLLGTRLSDYGRLMMVAHSMGGLVVQTFVIEEIERGAAEHLDRLTEIILYATPSGGLESARRFRWFKKQVADMSLVGPFITGLRKAWITHVDGRRADPARPWRFRLTLVAGQRDKFVPEESSLEPFPLDEHEVVPGNHVELVKPEHSQRSVAVLKKRLLRGNPTAEELRVLHGESPQAVDCLARIRAASSLGDVDTLGEIADELVERAVPLPTVENALALTLSGHRQHGRAVTLFDRYLSYEMDSGDKPFEHDAYSVQQLAVSLSALGRNLEALERLEQLPEDIRSNSETMGIRAGRLKREWLEDNDNTTAGTMSYQMYRAAYEKAKVDDDYGQKIYNGINVAFMSLMLGLTHQDLAEELLEVTEGTQEPDDYWTLATRAEALLLLKRFDAARDAYREAFVGTGMSRYLATTAAQALNIIAKLGDPAEAVGVKDVIENQYPSLPEAIEAQEAMAEAKELGPDPLSQ